MKKNAEKKSTAKSKIIEYFLNHSSASKVELSKQLNLSMPTVLSNVNDLLEKGLLEEVGECESTGGRKAKSLGINKGYRYAMGINITANHVGMILLNLGSEITKTKRMRLKFSSDVSYCSQLVELIQEFLAEANHTESLLGIGISIPGIINKKDQIVIKSHALQIENYSLSFIAQMLSCPVYFENDANAAMLAENPEKYRNAIYLSLNDTLGGAFCIDGTLYTGENQRAGEFGHMILVPQGKKCYCGKLGCVDAYCAASVLTKQNEINLEQFVDLLNGGDVEIKDQWKEYLEYLAILISNLRMAYDMDIILGGEVGGILPDHMMQLGKRVMSHNGFDRDLTYLKNCVYKREASAVGVAKTFFYDFMMQV